MAKLSVTEFADKALSGPELYRTIVTHRQQFNAVSGVNYSLHAPALIQMIPVELVLAEWQVDYNTMIEEMIYEEKPHSFQELLEILRRLQQRINSLEWYHELVTCNFKNFNDLKKMYGNASLVADDRVVFNIMGNKYRLVVRIAFEVKAIKTKWFGTHAEYDKIDVTIIRYKKN